jgi:hypothetical protein
MGDHLKLTPAEMVESGWVEALELLKDELRYDPGLVPSVDGHGCVRPDVCEPFFPPAFRETLRSAVGIVERVFPFPTLSPSVVRGSVKAVPFAELIELFAEATRRLPSAADLPRVQSEDELELQSRVVGLKAALLRMQMELVAAIMDDAEERRPAPSRPRRSRSYRTSIVRVIARVT